MIPLKNQKIWYLIIFFFFLTLFFLSPISGDDWGNYLVGRQGLRHMIGNAIGMYFTWEGRFVSRLFINLLTYHKWIWNFLNSFVLISILYLISKIYPFRNKKLIFLLSFTFLLFMNVFTFSQVVVWLAGNITYLFVIPLILLTIKLLYQKHLFDRKTTFLLVVLHIIIPMFVEHMAIVLIFLDFIFLLVDYLSYRKIHKTLFLFFILSIGSFALMFFSPGNQLRSGMENLAFNELSLLGKILYNLPNFVLYTYTVNYSLLLLICVTSFFMIHHQFRNSKIRWILYCLELPSLLFGGFYLLSSFHVISTNPFSENQYFVILYYIVLTALHFLFLIKNSNDVRKDLAILFYLIGILSNGVMLLSPTWGYRTSFATYLFLGISFLIVLDSYIREKKWMCNLTLSLAMIGMIFYFIFYLNIHHVYQENTKRIQNAKKTQANSIELIGYPGFAPCNINPSNEYHLGKFREYYEIDDSIEIRITANQWKYMIFYTK